MTIRLAKPNANILYSTLAKGPKLSREDQLNSSRLFFRELNRLGITSAIDAGGGFQNYPDDYGVVKEHRRILRTRAAGTSGESKLVPRQRVHAVGFWGVYG